MQLQGHERRAIEAFIAAPAHCTAGFLPLNGHFRRFSSISTKRHKNYIKRSSDSASHTDFTPELVFLGLFLTIFFYRPPLASSDVTREAKAFHGDLGGIMRQYYVHALPSRGPPGHLNLPLLNTTSAGFRGLNATGVGLAAFDGFPMSLVDLAQSFVCKYFYILHPIRGRKSFLLISA